MCYICKKKLSKGNSSTTLKRQLQMYNIFFDSQQDKIPKKENIVNRNKKKNDVIN